DNFSYVPVDTYSGSDTITSRDSGADACSCVATVSITITGVNDAPLALDDSYTTPEDTTLNVPAAGVLANDSDVDGDTLSAVLVTQPTHGSLTFNSNGSLSYATAANYKGTDT